MLGHEIDDSNSLHDSNAEENSLRDTTLSVGRGVSLTLGADALVVLDENLPNDASSLATSCGLLRFKNSLPTRSIPYYHILWANITQSPSTSSSELTISYAQASSSRKSASFRPRFLRYSIPEKSPSTSTSVSPQAWLNSLLHHAYSSNRAQSRKRLLVLLNPFSGRGHAKQLWQNHCLPILQAAECTIEVIETQYNGHAGKIAENLDAEAYDSVVCVSGDGLPHEVFNGFGRRRDARAVLRKIAIALLPGGSGNALCWNCFGTDSASLAAVGIVKGIRMPVDLASITQEDLNVPGGVRRTLSFLSQAVGIVAEVDLATEHQRWMGDARFTLGFLQRILGKTVWPCDIAMCVVDEDKASIRRKYREFMQDEGRSPHHTKFSPLHNHSGVDEPLVTILSSDNPAPTSATTNSTSISSTSTTTLPQLKFGPISSSLPSEFIPLTHYPNLGNFYAGNMTWMSAGTPFFAAALPADGSLDLITMDGNLGTLSALSTLLSVEDEDGGVFKRDELRYRKVKGYRVVPYGKGGWCKRTGHEEDTEAHGKGMSRVEHEYISIDGERIPFAPFQCEMHEGLGTVLSRTGWKYEAPEFG